MNYPKINIKTLLLSTFIFSACSTHEIISVSEVHLYNQDFGLVNNAYADNLIEQEYLSMSEYTQTDEPTLNDPELYTELTIDPDAFLAEDFVPTAPVISYKYKFDPKFYADAEWRTMDLQ